ncbi:FAD-dependent oxidoreductase [Janibacter anophelis]|uniref:FAD-dependent oxidoreductase n=1 Tax=Janibacter anophelis TaxID=319054 RepID=UPI000830E363|nr:FAD-dependent oxidoreductase [Janibacter anophelis]
MSHVVVIGHGMVGSRFVEDLTTADTAGEHLVTVLGEEACEPYNRVLLSDVVAGSRGLAAITLHSPAHPRVSVQRGVAVRAIDRERHDVVLADDSRVPYDHLVLATGAAARIPTLPGLDGPDLPGGVHVLRSIDDAREIVAATLNARRAIVLGGGVLGLEVASGLARRDLAVTVVHPAGALMERQLDESASRVVESMLRRTGVDQRVGVGAEEVVVEDGRLRHVRLTNGEVLAADLLVLSTGTLPCTGLAAEAGLAVERGVVVDADLTTRDPCIHAIGDCAQPPGGASGLVAQGWEQARRLADLLTGRDPEGVRSGVGDVVKPKTPGVDIVTMGLCGTSHREDPALRVVRLSDPSAGRHLEVVVRDGLLVGATAIGAGRTGTELITAYTRRTPVPADPAHLLLPAVVPAAPSTGRDSPSLVPDRATICRCNGVTKGDIRAGFDSGARTLEQIAETTRATTGCGGCTDAVCGIVDWLRAGDGPSPSDTGAGEDGFTQVKHEQDRSETRAS